MNWSALGSFALAASVMLGAFGAHTLRGRLDAYSMGIYERAVFYQFIHSLGMLVVPIFARLNIVAPSVAFWTCLLLAAGILIFCGSLYVLALTNVRTVGMITPIGGLAFIAAWLVLGWALVAQSR